MINLINSDKIGKFIVELRINKKLSQEKLGDLLGIGRDSVSKWERGVTLPSHEMLLRLSDIFEVSVNEILYGEHLNKQNEKKINEVSAVLFEKAKKGRKLIKRLIIIIVCMIALFGIYYFINSYKSVEVYTVSGDGDSIIIDNGVFIKTNGKLYFSINELKLKKEVNIKMITLYYKDIKNLIYSSDDTNIFISDYYGANEYFNIDYLKDITDNLYLHIEYDDDKSETIKLHFTQDYVNDILLFKKEKPAAANKANHEPTPISADLKYLISIIEKNFEKQESAYTYYEKVNNLEYMATYMPYIDALTLVIMENGTALETWDFDTYGKFLLYSLYDGKNIVYNFKYQDDEIKCLSGTCENAEEKIEFFWSYFYGLE